MVRQEMLQQQMKRMAMILMSQMTQLMQKHIVLKDARKAHDAEIQVDVAICWTAEFVYGGMLMLCSWLYLRSGRWKNRGI